MGRGRRGRGDGDKDEATTGRGRRGEGDEAALDTLGEIVDTLPAGRDEVVALAKVIRLVRREGFDRWTRCPWDTRCKCIGTELAVRESVRLMNDLTSGDPDMLICVRNMVVNQFLEEGGDDGEEDERLWGFVTRLTWSQALSTKEIWRAIDAMDDPPRVTRATMPDTEPRGVRPAATVRATTATQ